MAKAPTEHQQIGRALTDSFVTSLNFADKRRTYGDVVAQAVRRAGGDTETMRAAREHAAEILDGFEPTDAGVAASKRAAAAAAAELAGRITDRREEDRAAAQPDGRDPDEVYRLVVQGHGDAGVRGRARRDAADRRRATTPTAAEGAPTEDRAALVELMDDRTPRARRAELRDQVSGGEQWDLHRRGFGAAANW